MNLRIIAMTAMRVDIRQLLEIIQFMQKTAGTDAQTAVPAGVI